MTIARPSSFCLAEPLEARRLLSGVQFPAGTVVDITKSPYFVVPNDGIDDTAKIQQAINENVGRQFGSGVLYFPDGVYNVSNTLNWIKADGTGGKRYFTMQGQSKAGTIIRLKDSSTGFTNGAAPKAVIDTAPGSSAYNTAFFSHVKDLTIDTGSGNAGAVGLDYIASNMGSVRNVKVISSDPNKVGKYGFAFTKAWPGPFMASGLEAVGFDYGVRVDQTQYSVTFEDIALSDQKIAGVYTDSNGLWIHGLTSHNSVPAIRVNHARGMAVVVDANLTGGASNRAGFEIVAGASLYARDITASGYQSAIENGSSFVGGPAVNAYSSHAAETLFPSPESMLRLPIEPTPTFSYTQADIAVAANVGGDDTASIQGALNSGKPVVMLATPPAAATGNIFYNVNATLNVPKSVKLIIFNYQTIAPGSGLNNKPLFRFQSGTSADTTIFRDWNGVYQGSVSAYQQHDDQRTLVIIDAKVRYKTTIANPGNVFLDDTVGGGPNRTAFPIAPGQKVWARQLNVEDNFTNLPEPLIRNNGGQLWILGMKTEGPKTVLETINGGKSEVLGAFHYPVAAQPTDRPLYINNESSFTGAWFTSGFINRQVTETRNGVTRTLLRSDVPVRGTSSSDSAVALYAGYQPSTVTVDGSATADSFRIVRSGAVGQLFRTGNPVPIEQWDPTIAPNVVVNLLDGDDRLEVDFSGGDPLPAGGLTVNGGEGIDQLVVAGTAESEAMALSAGAVSRNGRQIAFATTESLSLNLGLGSDTLALDPDAVAGFASLRLFVTGSLVTTGASLPNFSNVQLLNGHWDLNGVSQTIDVLNGTGTITNNGIPVQLTLGATGGSGNFAGAITDGSGASQLYPARPIVAPSPLSTVRNDIRQLAAPRIVLPFGAISLNKVGNGTLELSGASTFGGAFQLQAGMTRISSASALGSGSGATLIAGGSSTAQLQLAGGISIVEPIYLAGRDIVAGVVAPHLVNASGSNALLGRIYTAAGGSGYAARSDAGTLRVQGDVVATSAQSTDATLQLDGVGAGVITGVVRGGSGFDVNLVKRDAGTWLLSGGVVPSGGTANAAADTSVEAGTLTVGGTIARGAVTVSAGTLTLLDAGVLRGHAVTSLSIGTQGVVDVTRNFFDVFYVGPSPLAALTVAVDNGNAGGAPPGPRIIQTTGDAGAAVAIEDDGSRVRVGYAAVGPILFSSRALHYPRAAARPPAGEQSVRSWLDPSVRPLPLGESLFASAMSFSATDDLRLGDSDASISTPQPTLRLSLLSANGLAAADRWRSERAPSLDIEYRRLHGNRLNTSSLGDTR